jgi:hypothetical protein
MKTFDIEKFVAKVNTIGKLIAFIGLILSIAIKLNRIFKFWSFDKKADNKESEPQTSKK